MKNILIINPFSGQIGPNSFLIEFVKSNNLLGNTTTILYPKIDNVYDQLNKFGINIIITPFIELNHINNRYFKFFKRISNEFKLIFFLLFNSSLKKYSYCISNSELYSFSLFIFSKFTKIVVIVHSLSFTNYNFLSKIVFHIQNKSASKYIAVSKKVKEMLLIQGVKKPIFVLYNTIDLNKFKYKNLLDDNNKINILSIIHPVKHKGAHHLINIISELTRIQKNVHFTVLGWHSNSMDSKYKKLIEDQIEHLHLSSYISLRENVTNVLEFYEKADIYVHPSESESFGIVITEAMALKIPVISFNVGAISEIIQDNESGFLIDPFDIQYFVLKINDLIVNKSKRVTFGENGFRIVKACFNSENLPKNINKILN